ncbi:MAG: peptidase [Magnetococcales bacterium]|nr:peptidase [Magnetococcales bacterium]
MTYCVGIALDDGLVFASDSRTSAGIDQVLTYSKMHQFQWDDDRFIMLLSSGNLATTQLLVRRLEMEMQQEGVGVTLKNANSMVDLAEHVGQLSVSIQNNHQDGLKQDNTLYEASFILGGQIGRQPMELFLIYPQGNYITPSSYGPFLQIGETKYGKPILDRIIRPGTTLDDAARCALVSLDSTIRSNLSVGPPVDLAIYHKDHLKLSVRRTLQRKSPIFEELRSTWNQGLLNLFHQLPAFDWENTGEEHGENS